MASILKRFSSKPVSDEQHAPVHAADDASLPAGSSGKTIRSGVAGRISAENASHLAAFNLDDLVQSGQNQIERARVHVSQMLADARLQAESLLIEAEARGYEDGLRRAEADIASRVTREAEVKSREQVQLITRGVAAMRQAYNDWMRQYADVLTETALAAAERLTRARVTRIDATPSVSGSRHPPMSAAISDVLNGASATPDGGVQIQEHLLVTWAREALHSTRSSTRLVLAVHPDTLAALGHHLDGLLASPELPEDATILGDENLEVGDVVVRHDGGEILAGLSDQLRRLREELS